MEVAKRLVEELDRKIRENDPGEPFFTGDGYTPHPFKREYFRPIRPSESARRVAFVDGGNVEVLGAPNFSVQLNRVFFNVFDGDRRVLSTSLPWKLEFYSATFSIFREGEIYYDTFIQPMEEGFLGYLPAESDLSFNSFDRTVTIGNMRADISRVASIARRFAEWKYSLHIVEEELDEGDVIVSDRTLQTAFTNEGGYAERAFEASERSGVLYTGLAKTSRLYTSTGLSLLGAVQEYAEREEIGYPRWFYYPVVDIVRPDHRAELYLVKLNPSSERIFRFEIYKDQAETLDMEDVNEVLSQISLNARDISFPGYPYGLVDADRNSRVREGDVESYKMMLLSEISRLGKWDKFARHIHATDAHDILNMLIG